MQNQEQIEALNFLFQATQQINQPAAFHRQCQQAAETLGKHFAEVPQAIDKKKSA